MEDVDCMTRPYTHLLDGVRMTTLSVMTDDGCRSLMEHGAVPVKHVGSDLPTRIKCQASGKVLLGR